MQIFFEHRRNAVFFLCICIEYLEKCVYNKNRTYVLYYGAFNFFIELCSIRYQIVLKCKKMMIARE
nr:MAG TPA: hypothetical protein [Caudoviricetes sp.]